MLAVIEVHGRCYGMLDESGCFILRTDYAAPAKTARRSDITAHGNTRRCAVCARKRHLDQMRAAAARRYSALQLPGEITWHRAPKGNPRHAPPNPPPMLEPRFDGAAGQFLGFSIWAGGDGLTRSLSGAENRRNCRSPIRRRPTDKRPGASETERG